MYNYHNAFSSKIIMVINWWHGPRSINNWDIINQFSLTRISYLDNFHALNTSFVKTSIFCGIIINWFRFRTVLLRECTLFLVPLASCAGGCHENKAFFVFQLLIQAILFISTLLLLWKVIYSEYFLLHVLFLIILNGKMYASIHIPQPYR